MGISVVSWARELITWTEIKPHEKGKRGKQSLKSEVWSLNGRRAGGTAYLTVESKRRGVRLSRISIVALSCFKVHEENEKDKDKDKEKEKGK